MDDKMREEMDKIQANMLTMQADIMALFEKASLVDSEKDPRAIMDELRMRARKHHARLLLALENIDPALAARLDKRREHREE